MEGQRKDLGGTDYEYLALKKQHEESAKTWRPVVYKRGEKDVQRVLGEPQMIATKKQTLASVKVTIDNRSGTDLTSQSTAAGL